MDIEEAKKLIGKNVVYIGKSEIGKGYIGAGCRILKVFEKTVEIEIDFYFEKIKKIVLSEDLINTF